MARKPKVRGTAAEDHLPGDRLYASDGRKLHDSAHVGESAPDTDADEPLRRPKRTK